MATLIAYQDGNWTGATTWKAVATGTGANPAYAFTDYSPSGSYVYSPTFTITSGEEIEGVAMAVGRTLTPSGTFSIALSDDNGVTATREVTVNTSDLPYSGGGYGFVFFKFGTPLTADGGNDYRLGIKGNNTARVRGGASNNYNRVIRKSDIVSIASTDVTYICAEWTAAGTKNNITVTMNETATTAYGGLTIGQGGVLSYGTSASTNYYLKLSGNLEVWDGGTLNIGTSASRIPSTSTAVLEFNCGSNVQYGLEVQNGGTCNIYGATRTNTKVLLTADANSGQKVVTVQDTTDWAVGDEFVIANTTQTKNSGDRLTVATVDSATQITATANLSMLHQGTSPYQAEVGVLTRNVKIRGMSASLCTYVNCAATSNFTAEYTEFYYSGSNTAGKEGLASRTTSAGTFSVAYCSFHDTNSNGNSLVTVGTSGSPSITDCVFYGPGVSYGFKIAATSGVPTLKNNWVLYGYVALALYDCGGIIEGNRLTNSVTGLETYEAATFTSFKDNVIHSCDGPNFFSTAPAGTIENLTCWRNKAAFNIGTNLITVTGLSSYHNTPSNFSASASGARIINSMFNGGTGQSIAASSREVDISAVDVVFENCTFGATNQATAFGSVGARSSSVFINCTVNESITFSSQSSLTSSPSGRSYIHSFDKLNGTSGSHRAYKAYGYTASDQTTYRTAAPSEALIPNNASNKLPSGSKKFAVANGTTATVTVYVNKSGTYNGNQPRLIVKRNIVGGITSDTVLATASGGTGSWLVLSGTTASVTDDCVLEVYVDCDGTAGTVYVDDWSVS